MIRVYRLIGLIAPAGFFIFKEVSMDHEVLMTRAGLGNTEFDKVLVQLGYPIADLSAVTQVRVTVCQVHYTIEL